MSDPSSHSPWVTLFSLLAVGAAVWIIAWVFPEEGIPVSENITLKFASLDDFNPLQQDVEHVDVDELLASYAETMRLDSISRADSLAGIQAQLEAAEAAKAAEATRRAKLMRLQIPADAQDALYAFFNRVAEKKQTGEQIRVMHYGDSQIEGDRITSYLRNSWQKKWGGNGPGLIPAVEVVPSIAIDQDASESFERFTVYGRQDTTIKHKRFGVLGSFAQVRLKPDSEPSIHWLEYRPSKVAFARVKSFDKVRIWLGSPPVNCPFKVVVDGIEMHSEKLDTTLTQKEIVLDLESTPGVVRLEFNAAATPEVYAVSLESNEGLIMDNIPMRGSSGTVFKKMDRTLLSQQYASLNPDLLLLQYGGNTVPYVKDSTQAENYGKWFASQIRFLKSQMPNASVVVIGPSDMAYKEKDEFVTYPYLECVRNGLQDAAQKTGCAFWDIYEVMGGKNSMASWVNADPALAGTDYVHFTPKGARKIAELLDYAFQYEYDKWQENAKK